MVMIYGLWSYRGSVGKKGVSYIVILYDYVPLPSTKPEP